MLAASSTPPRTVPTPSTVPLGVAALFIPAYVAADWLSYLHPVQQFGITPWNPQPALAVALLALRGQRWLPLVAAAVLAAEWLVRGGSAAPGSALAVAAALTLGYAAIAHGLSGRTRVNPALETSGDVLRLVLVAAVGALATGLLFVGALMLVGRAPIGQPLTALLSYWIGDTVGILVTLPLLFLVVVPKRRGQLAALLRSRETLLHVAFTALMLAAVFAADPGDQVRRFYLIFLPLIVVAARLGLPGAIVATLAIQVAVVVTGQLRGFTLLTIFELQSLLIALTVTALFLGATVDERRRAEADLRRTVRLAAAGEMAAALAHELNQPLTALSNYARASRLLADAGPAQAPLLKETLEKLGGEAARAANVVRRLREFFRTGTTQLEPASVPEVLARAVAALGERAQEARAAIEVDAPEALPPAPIDATQIEIVFRNLIGNALDAVEGTPEPRRVRIELSASAAVLRAEVRDSGPGVAVEDLARIFEPFETGRATGMGMGLAISRAIVETHGGQLWAEAGPGGRFCFTLPLAGGEHG